MDETTLEDLENRLDFFIEEFRLADFHGKPETANLLARQVAKNAEMVISRVQELRVAAQKVLDNIPCSDPDCCEAAIAENAARTDLAIALAG